MTRTAIPLALALLMAATSARAEDGLVIDTAHDAILIHGNYCGPGNRAPLSPIDALDRACMHHDQCSPRRGQIGTCACNDRLNREAAAVADDPSEPQSVRDTAEFIAGTALALPCR